MEILKFVMYFGESDSWKGFKKNVWEILKSDVGYLNYSEVFFVFLKFQFEFKFQPFSFFGALIVACFNKLTQIFRHAIVNKNQTIPIHQFHQFYSQAFNASHFHALPSSM
jgi:hypothetical protein